jgi:hypothetical protein
VTRWFLIALCSTGCSLAMTRPDPDRPHDKTPVCDTGKGPVVIDGLMGGIMGITTLGMLGSSSSGAQSAAIIPAIIGAIYLGSAVHGNGVANECKKAMDDFAAAPPVEKEPPRIAHRKPKPVPTVAAAPAPVPVPVPAPAEPPAEQPWSAFWKELP